MTCALCLQPIDGTNDSREHIVPNAIGGWLKVSGVLCSSCNSEAGRLWDSDLAAQLNPLALLISIVRDRGETPSQVLATGSGKKYLYRSDGTLAPAKREFNATPSEEGGTRIRISARSIQEARSMLESAKGKYPGIDVEQALSLANIDESYLNEYLDIPSEFGGPLAGRSLVKSVLCLAVANGVSPLACDAARRYLTDDEGEPCFGYFYARDLVQQRSPGLPFHCVAVSNRGTGGQLLGYVEYFGMRRQVVCLSGNYSGPDLHCSYAVNPITGEELSLNFEIEFSREDIAAIYAYERAAPAAIEAAFGPVIENSLLRADERQRSRAAKQALDYAWENCGAGPGEILTLAHISKISALVAERLGPYIEHLSRRRRKS